MYKIVKLTLIILSLSVIPFLKCYSQELRAYGSAQVYGYIEGGFNGFGLGLESPYSNKTSLGLDINYGSHQMGKAIEFKPSFLFYFKENYRGFFIGPSIKYIKIIEPKDVDELEDNIYAFGFSTGLKSNLTNKLVFIIILNPHLSIGGRREGNVGGISGQIGLGYKWHTQ
jgi:hypothetical protein